MPDLLLEVGCEELPASACREIIEQAPELLARGLEAAGLQNGAGPVTVSVAPRRFALFSSGLPDRVVGASRSVRGPAVEAAFAADGTPQRAGEGFARAQGVRVEDLVVREGEGGRRFVFAEHAGEDRSLAELVPDLAARVIDGLRFSKTMRWGDGAGPRFSRPIRWIVAKVDEATVPFQLHGLTAGDVSQGHRFLGGPARVPAPADYHAALRAVGVVADHGERRRLIVEGLDAAAAEVGCVWRDPGGKLEEVLFLVEHPSVVRGAIAEEHLRLPPRVLVTAMQSHQRYFPLERPDGALQPMFLAVSNGDPAHAAVIARGNEDVLDARLQDAAFSFDRDREAGLAALNGRLATIVFHQRLGSVADKRDRLVDGVAALAAATGADAGAAAIAEEAARLAKADQGAILVAEFSELEGYVAAHYARLEGHDEAVGQAIEEQYLPAGADAPSPASDAGALLAAADRIDNLVGAFAVDEAPTGSKDPYGLRRAGAGLVRIALERGWDAPLRPVLQAAHERLAAQGADLVLGREQTVDALEAFLQDRLAFQLQSAEGVGPEASAAAHGAGLGSLVATAAWARALEAALGSEELAAAWTACTRCQRLGARAGEAGAPAAAGVDEDPGERALAEALDAAQAPLASAREARDFAAALRTAAGVAPAVDRFFADVLVNVDDPGVRARRLGLVLRAADLLTGAADFSRIRQPGGAG
ncbi:MAG: glycyl-tRNA synthetase beta chain [Miltoncostaeaceae bacterium]|nr:glycyl-tRNA synthetase beta chain [Miltoncostaeaceae bacterium]